VSDFDDRFYHIRKPTTDHRSEIMFSKKNEF